MGVPDRYPVADMTGTVGFAEDLKELRRRLSELEARSADTGRIAGVAVTGTPSGGQVLTALSSAVAGWQEPFAALLAGAGGVIDMAEQSPAPTIPAPNRARVYARDNGSGKTQLVVQFPTGAVQVLATEP